MTRKKRILLIFWILILCIQTRALGDVLKAGDIVEIKVERQENLGGVFTVDEKGNITLPLIGVVYAEGKTPLQLQDEITEKLSVYIKKPKVAVSTGAPPFLDETGVLATRVFTLEYADAVLLEKTMQGVVSGRGRVSADAATNSLVATDTVANLSMIENVVKQLDVFGMETRQVLIEAQIIELKTRKGEEIGARWFMDRDSGKEFAGSFDKEFSLSPLPTEITTSKESGGIALEQRTAIPNVGLSTLAEGGSFFYGKLFGNYQLDLLLNALINEGKASILARPKIVVENSREAKLEIVTKFPYRDLLRISSTSVDEVYTTKFLDIGVTLKVTPYIKKDNVINMEVEPEVSFMQGEVDKIPVMTSRKAMTRVNVEDGHTLIIGGLLQDRKTKNVRKVPLLGDIPIVGLLFRFKDTENEKTELMVFITPHILTREKAAEITEKDMSAMEKIEEK